MFSLTLLNDTITRTLRDLLRDNLVNNIITNANDNNPELIVNGDRLSDLLELLDELHTAASDNTLPRFISLGEQDVLGMLKELVYTAQETISEIETNRVQRAQRAARKFARQTRHASDERAGRANGAVAGKTTGANGRASQVMPTNIVQFSDHFGQHIVQPEEAPASEVHQVVPGTRHA